MPTVAVASPLPGADAFRTPERGAARRSRRASRRMQPSAEAGATEIEIENENEGEGGDVELSGRKRKSKNAATKGTPGSASAKKRARVSMGTPGKATLLDAARGQDVEKRFVELEVSDVYRAIRKQTGALGGNAAGGAIYGEITQASFQRVVDFMKDKCELSAASLFLDVGSGLGKPNFHVAIDPGVEVSYGVELEDLRWHLSLHNLRSVLALESAKKRLNRTIFTAGDITDAKTLDPFSHIYSFDVGFPPDVMDSMANSFNRSNARYFVSFHPPRKVIDMYGFDVEDIGHVSTSMAGSSEGHRCYFYRRTGENPSLGKDVPVKIKDEGTPSKKLHVDPLFRKGFELLSRGREGVQDWIVDFFGEANTGRTRRQKAKNLQLQRQMQERPLESYYRVIGKTRAFTMESPSKLSRKKL